MCLSISSLVAKVKSSVNYWTAGRVKDHQGPAPAYRNRVRNLSRRRDFWGHAVIPSWHAEATTVLDLDGYPRPVAGQQQTAEVTVGADGFNVNS